MSHHREQKIMYAVACPACHAPRGEPCRLTTEAERATSRGRLLVHGARRAAWQALRVQQTPDFYARPSGPRAGLLVPQSEPARVAALNLVESATATEAGIEVPDLRAAIDWLTADGWRIE